MKGCRVGWLSVWDVGFCRARRKDGDFVTLKYSGCCSLSCYPKQFFFLNIQAGKDAREVLSLLVCAIRDMASLV